MEDERLAKGEKVNILCTNYSKFMNRNGNIWAFYTEIGRKVNKWKERRKEW
jgi:hypothetical protein